jgi:predicted NAD/FAD-binding protein
MKTDKDEEYHVKRVAVVGSGASALGALWALGHSQHRVYLYEAQNRLGGHANAVCFRNERNGKSCMVDTAFMMINDTTYRWLDGQS